MAIGQWPTQCVAGVFSSKRGELRQRYREGQEDQLGALGLVVNMIVLWNTIYMEAVLEQFRKEGYPVNEEDKARLSPLIHEHINIQGRHSFVMPEAVVKGKGALQVAYGIEMQRARRFMTAATFPRSSAA